MDEGVQAAGAMLYVLSESVKLATDLLVATVKTTGSTGKAVAAMLAAHWKNSTQKEMGEISLKAMVKRKEPFDMLAMDTVDAGKFRRLANQVGLLYSIRADKSDYDDMTVDGLTSVLYRQQDAPLVKSILERLHINTLVTAQTEDIAEITKPVATMELQIGQAVLRISNQTDPKLLEQTLKLIGAFSC